MSLAFSYAVFRNRMDPVFFAEMDPDFKNPDPDFKNPDPSGFLLYFTLKIQTKIDTNL